MSLHRVRRTEVRKPRPVHKHSVTFLHQLCPGIHCVCTWLHGKFLWSSCEVVCVDDPDSASGGGCHKYHFSRDKSFVAANACLSPQTRVCHHKWMFVVIKHLFCHNKSLLAATKIFLSRQTRACCDETFVATSILLSPQQTCFVVTNTCLLQQNSCRDKNDPCGSSR